MEACHLRVHHGSPLLVLGLTVGHGLLILLHLVRVRVRVGVRAWKEGSGARRTGRVRVGEFRG